MYRIVIVDDEPNTCDFLALYLSREISGFEVVGQFYDGKSAWEYVQHHEVDCILTDIKMSDMDGLEIAEKISNTKLQIKVILMSGYCEFDYAKRGIQCGVTSYLLKPLDYAKVSEELFRVQMELNEERKRAQQYKQMMNYSREQFIIEICARVHKVPCKKRLLQCLGLTTEIFTAEGFLATVSIEKNDDDNEEATEIRLRTHLWDAKKEIYLLSYRPTEAIICQFGSDEDFTVLQESLKTTGFLLNEKYVFNGLKELPEVYQKVSETVNVVDVVTTDSERVIKKAISYIDKHYTDEITREQVAASCFMNPDYFGRYFKNQTGYTFIDFLTKRRVDKAMQLLHEDLSIDSIAHMVGYGSARYFSRVFKAATGCTPVAFRREILKREFVE